MLEPVHRLHQHSVYTGVQQAAVLAGGVAFAVSYQPWAAVTTAAVSVLMTSHRLTTALAPKSLASHCIIKLSFAVSTALVTAVALLAMASFTISLSSVSMLASILLAPTVAELLLESLLVSLYAPSTEEILMSKAKKLLEKTSDKDHKNGVKIYSDLAKQQYKAAYVQLALCYLLARGVKKDEKLAQKWIERGYRAKDPDCTLFYALFLVRQEGKKEEVESNLQIIERQIGRGLRWGQVLFLTRKVIQSAMLLL